MTDRPILFSSPMVRALLDGRKTQTRRILKATVPEEPAMDNLSPSHGDKEPRHPRPYLDAYCGAAKTPDNPRGMTANWAWWTRDDRPGALFKVGYVPGDRLWVREPWKVNSTFNDLAPRDIPDVAHVFYLSDPGYSPSHSRYRHTMFMPRWASRLTLTVTDVRVQRLQEITEDDAKAEGALWHEGHGVGHSGWRHDPNDGVVWRNCINSFCSLWLTINGTGSWDANPYVVALTFTVGKHNIDRVAP